MEEVTILMQQDNEQADENIEETSIFEDETNSNDEEPSPYWWLNY